MSRLTFRNCISVAVVFISAFFASVAVADVDPKRVHAIDYRHHTKAGDGVPSIIFRGNSPVSRLGFNLDYNNWFKTLASSAKKQVGITLDTPDKVYIIDISFENALMDYQYRAEEKFWAKDENKAKGEYHNWELLGTVHSPAHYTLAEQAEMINKPDFWHTDQLPSRTEAIHQMMLKGPPAGYSQLIIYFHCTHGADRTGEFADSYRLAFHNKIAIGYGTMASSMIAERRATPPALVADGSDADVVDMIDDVVGSERHAFTDLGFIYALGCQEGRRCPTYTFTANAGWFCLWSNEFRGTHFKQCSSAYKCLPMLMCSATSK